MVHPRTDEVRVIDLDGSQVGLRMGADVKKGLLPLLHNLSLLSGAPHSLALREAIAKRSASSQNNMLTTLQTSMQMFWDADCLSSSSSPMALATPPPPPLPLSDCRTD